MCVHGRAAAQMPACFAPALTVLAPAQLRRLRMLEPRMSNDTVEVRAGTPDEEVANEGTYPLEPVL